MRSCVPRNLGGDAFRLSPKLAYYWIALVKVFSPSWGINGPPMLPPGPTCPQNRVDMLIGSQTELEKEIK